MPFRELIVPSKELVTRCGDFLHGHGWRREIAAENFEPGAKAFAYSIENRMGMLVTGGVGTGKTKYLEALSSCTINGRSFKRFYMKNKAHADFLNRFENGEEIRKLYNFHVVIDDLGEEEPASWYSTGKFEAVLDFILGYLSPGCGQGMIFISTNLFGDQLLNRYSARIDCFKDFLLPVNFKGKDVRQWMLPL